MTARASFFAAVLLAPVMAQPAQAQNGPLRAPMDLRDPPPATPQPAQTPPAIELRIRPAASFSAPALSIPDVKIDPALVTTLPTLTVTAPRPSLLGLKPNADLSQGLTLNALDPTQFPVCQIVKPFVPPVRHKGKNKKVESTQAKPSRDQTYCLSYQTVLDNYNSAVHDTQEAFFKRQAQIIKETRAKMYASKILWRANMDQAEKDADKATLALHKKYGCRVKFFFLQNSLQACFIESQIRDKPMSLEERNEPYLKMKAAWQNYSASHTKADDLSEAERKEKIDKAYNDALSKIGSLFTQAEDRLVNVHIAYLAQEDGTHSPPAEQNSKRLNQPGRPLNP